MIIYIGYVITVVILVLTWYTVYPVHFFASFGVIESLYIALLGICGICINWHFEVTFVIVYVLVYIFLYYSKLATTYSKHKQLRHIYQRSNIMRF